MATFSRSLKEVKRPPGSIVLSPIAFMPKWEGRPESDVCIGITMLSESDLTSAKQMAVTEAWRLYPRKEDTLMRLTAASDLVVRAVVAMGTCDPNNVELPFELWPAAPEDVVKDALTAEGCRAVFDAIERVSLELSPVLAEADDDDIETAALFAVAVLDRVPAAKAKRIRRLFTYCLNELTPYVPDPPRHEPPAPTP